MPSARHAAEVAARDDAAAAASRPERRREDDDGGARRWTLSPRTNGAPAARLIATLLTATASATAAVPEGAEGADVFEERRRLGDGVEDARLATSELLRHVPAARRGAYAAPAAAAEIAMAAEGAARRRPCPRLPAP